MQRFTVGALEAGASQLHRLFSDGIGRRSAGMGKGIVVTLTVSYAMEHVMERPKRITGSLRGASVIA
jgi:hypothetical protein